MARGAGARNKRRARRARAVRTGAGRAQTQSSTTIVASSEPIVARLERRAQARELAAAAATLEPLTSEEAALERMRATLAMGACAGCDHAFTDHLGSEGPCTVEDCSCTSYEAPNDAEPDADPDDQAAVAALTVSRDGVRVEYGDLLPVEFDPSEEVTLALRVIEAGGPAAVEYVEQELARFQLVDFTITAAGADPVVSTIPEAHQPGARTVTRNRSPKAPAPAAATGPAVWSAIIAPEGKLTSDRRAFAPGSITWRDLPLTLMAMIETSEGGHIGAQVSGRIDDIWRDEKAGLIRARGVFDSGEFGQQIANLVDDKTLRGVSVDLAISKYETGPESEWFDENGNWAPKEQAADEAPSLLDLYSEDTIAVVLAAEIGMVTVCPFPAFAEAQIAMGDSLVAGANPAFWTVTQQGGWTVERCSSCAEEALAASAASDELTLELTAAFSEAITASGAGLAPDAPPAEWFSDPELEGPTAITVDDAGRIYGHAATWGVCHIGFPGSCKTAPHSKSDYEFFHLGEVVCDDGSRVSVGQITIDSPHADLRLDRAGATAHYDHTGTVVAHVACGEDEHGIWVAGALQPDAPVEKVRLLRGAKLSGDWRGGELVALLAVNVPGFPVPRARASLVAAGDGEDAFEVVSLVAAGIPVFEAELTEEERERFAVLREHAAFAALADQAA